MCSGAEEAWRRVREWLEGFGVLMLSVGRGINQGN